MSNTSNKWNLRDAVGFWISPTESRRLTAKREVGRRKAAVDWQRIFYAAAAAVVLATAVLLTFR